MASIRQSNFHQDTKDVGDSHVLKTIPVPRNSAAPRNVETSSALPTTKLPVLSKTALKHALIRAFVHKAG